MRPANLAARAVAVLIDGLIAFIVLGVAIALPTGQFHHSGGSVSFNLHGAPALLWALAAFGYWLLFEAFWGTTPAKRMFGIYVVGRDGGRPSLGQSAARNVLRFVDGIPFFVPYLLGWAFALGDVDRRRIGDRAAGTRVVSRS